MRASLLVSIVLLAACQPRMGSSEWVATTYSTALFQADTKTLHEYLEAGLRIEDAPKDPKAEDLRVVRLCEQEEKAEVERRFLVLFSGGLDDAVQALDVVEIKAGDAWRIRSARVARTSEGFPMYYLRNCQVSPRKYDRPVLANGGLPSPAGSATPGFDENPSPKALPIKLPK